MKNLFKTTLLAAAVALTAVSCRQDDTLLTENPTAEQNDAAARRVYQVRIGVRHQDGTTQLNGSIDMGSIYATNVVTGQVYEADGPYSGGFRQLPAFIHNLPKGTYEFSADQGQGGWVGFGTTTVTINNAAVGAGGYATVYIPINWTE